VSFLGGIDPATGKILDRECESRDQSVSDKIFCFPYGRGSTVGSYAMYQLKLNRLAPSAIVNGLAEPIIATGAIIAEIPMVDGVDVSILRTGDDMTVDAENGFVELPRVSEKHVVTCIVRNRGRILLLKRSDKVGSYRGQWAGVSGYVEHGEEEEAAARRELEEELGRGRAHLAKRIEPQRFRDGDVVWCVHAFLFDLKDRSVRMDWEHQTLEWIVPEDVAKYQTVPGLREIVCKLL
jgi:predicted aconitase with swiveling domain/8-oxo-dGTP pyrophosphatase MutT (NUDIX family)